MTEKPNKQPPKRKKYDEIAATIADISGYSPRYVRMVREGEKTNENLMEAIVTYQAGKNQLLAAVRELVPFKNAASDQ
jgi:hypothetical protein